MIPGSYGSLLPVGCVFILTISTERGVAEVATLGWGCVHLE